MNDVEEKLFELIQINHDLIDKQQDEINLLSERVDLLHSALNKTVDAVKIVNELRKAE